MTTLDTTWLSFTSDCIDSIDLSSFIENHVTATRTGKLINKTELILKKDRKPFGITSVTISNGYDVLVQCSAKVLRDGYAEGLNISNYTAITEALKPHIVINVHEFKNRCKVVLCDVTQNVNLSEFNTTTEKVLDLLTVVNSDKRIKIERYDTKTNQGIVYRGNQKYKRNRAIVYDKEKEMKLRKNSDFIQQLNNPFAFLESTKNVLRFELNNAEKRTVKERFNTTDNHLITLLNSKQPVLANYLRNITKKSTDKLLILQRLTEKEFDQLYTPYEVKNFISYCNSFDFNENEIKKNMQKDNRWTYDNFYKHWYRKKNSYSSLFWFLQAKNNDIKLQDISEIDTIIKELENQVLRAA